MNMILTLLYIEFLKIRRSLALWMTLACPLLVVLLNTGILLKNGNVVGKIGLWQGFWLGNFALWCYFMLPLYIALITGLLNGHEHKHQTWRLMLTQPISTRQLYTAKAMLAGLMVLGACVSLVLLIGLAMALLGMAAYPLNGALDYPFVVTLFKVWLASLPVIMIQHYVSWRFPNIVAPLALGVGATMGIIQLASSRHWPYFPWTYSLMAGNGSNPERQMLALQLGLGLAVLIFGISLYWSGKQEMKT